MKKELSKSTAIEADRLFWMKIILMTLKDVITLLVLIPMMAYLPKIGMANLPINGILVLNTNSRKS